MSSSVAKNLEAISRAIDKHNASCPFPAGEVRMNPYELERLGWDEVRGLPVVGDPAIGTGCFRIVCSQEGSGEGIEEVEAIGIVNARTDVRIRARHHRRCARCRRLAHALPGDLSSDRIWADTTANLDRILTEARSALGHTS